MIRVLLLVPISLISFVLILLTNSDYKEFKKQESWIATKASIQSSEIDSQKRKKGKISHCPLIKVSYVVNSKEFTSKLRLGEYPGSLFSQQTKKTLKRFPVGEDIDALVNPRNRNEVRASSYSLGWGFYLLLACTIGVSGTFFYVLFAPANQFRQQTP